MSKTYSAKYSAQLTYLIIFPYKQSVFTVYYCKFCSLFFVHSSVHILYSRTCNRRFDDGCNGEPSCYRQSACVVCSTAATRRLDGNA